MTSTTERPLRLALDASAWCDGRGLGRYAAQMATALAASGRVDLRPFAPDDDWGPWSLSPELRERTTVWRSRYLPWLSYRLPRLVSREQPEVTWFPANEAAPWGCHPYILTIHDVAQAHFPERFFSGVWEYRRYLRRLRGAVAGAARVVTDAACSADDLQQLCGCHPEKLAVVPLGVEAAFRPAPAGEYQPVLQQHQVRQPYVLYVGGFDFRKNLPTLIEAFARLVSRGRPETLILVGTRSRRPAMQPDLEAVVRKHRLGDKVIFLEGTVNDDTQLRALYSGAALFVFPSLFEGFGLPPLEAMACGTPVVCSQAASLPEVVGDAAVSVAAEDASVLAEAMRGVLEDEDRQARLRSAGLLRARLFTWTAAAERLCDLASAVARGT
ncbi:MAG TPA: glycosyltransferase family 1 protein [Armatimonadota bacterium]|jgi:glycosyltransferase involved in cell wall biosynthesis